MLTKELSKLPATRLSFIESMYAQAVSKLPNGDLWSYEAKFDGYRCLAAKHSNGVVLWSRRGNGFTTRFRDVACACANFPPDTLIDGEVGVMRSRNPQLKRQAKPPLAQALFAFYRISGRGFID